MCEYCGCQALETIDKLTQEHERVVTLISHVRDAHRGGEVARMAEVAREIAAVLGPHTRQDGVFPAALASLTTEQWEAIEAVRARVGTRIPEPSP
ncbi:MULTISPECIES: hypothetical protein [Streptomyces]|uniref:hypothetical protein n=1 Tax=Streptomyces lycopersici TaxID=2974589 RepID=UPI0021D17789|nr:hypothetical protein [Streptomyces sp. NEAU-383]